MLMPVTCLTLLLTPSIFLALTLPTAGAPGSSSQLNAVGNGVASGVLEVLAALNQSQSLQSSISGKSNYTAANSTSLPRSSQSTQSSSASSVSNTTADRLASTVAGLANVSPQSALFNVLGASAGAINSAQPIPITNPPPASTASVQSLGLNGTVSPLPNVATVVLAGTSQVIYKQTFTNLQNITAAENITTVLTQYSSQSTSDAVPFVAAPVAVMVGAAGIWYRIGSTGPPIGPPDLPKLTIGTGRCKLIPFFCPGRTPSLPVPVPPGPPKVPDPPKDVQNPPSPADDSEPESEEPSQSRGKPTNMPSMTQSPTTKATYSAQSQTIRSMSSTQKSVTSSVSSIQISTRRTTSVTRSVSSIQNSTRRTTSSTQPLLSFNWVTDIPSADPIFLTTSENASAMSSYLQAQFASMGIAFDQEDAMAGIEPVNGTVVTATFASSGGEETDVSAAATSGADAAAATAAGRIAGALEGLVAMMTSMSSAAGIASTSAETASLVASTASAAANDPPSSSPAPPAPTPSPIPLLACTQFIELLQGGLNPHYIHTCSCNDGSKPTATSSGTLFACPSQVDIVVGG